MAWINLYLTTKYQFVWKRLKIFCLKGIKTYFEWKFKGFGIFLGCSESLSIVFSPLLKQVCLILFSVILFSSVCWDLNEEKGRRGEGKGNCGLSPFPPFSGVTQAGSAALSCEGDTLCDPLQSCRRANHCADNFRLHLCAPVTWECGWAKHRLVQVLKDEDKVI